MLCYEISFHKQLCDSTGHEHRTEQGRVLVDAPTLDDAVKEAKSRFARSRGLADWRCYADEIDVRPVGEGERRN